MGTLVKVWSHENTACNDKSPHKNQQSSVRNTINPTGVALSNIKCLIFCLWEKLGPKLVLPCVVWPQGFVCSSGVTHNLSQGQMQPCQAGNTSLAKVNWHRVCVAETICRCAKGRHLLIACMGIGVDGSPGRENEGC